MSQQQVQQIGAAWQGSEQVCNLAVKGILARVDEHKAITRKEVCQNIAIIKPIVKYVGP